MNHRLSLSFHQIQYFLAIADNGSLRAAAQRLGLSQPAVSKSLKALESTLGVPLFLRNAGGVTLTPIGEFLLERARMIDNEVVRTANDIQALAGSAVSNIMIGSSAIPSMLLVPPAIAQFSRKCPKARIELVGGMPSVLLPRLMDGSLDFVIGPSPSDVIPDTLETHLLMKVRVNVIVRKGHPLEKAKTLRDLAGAKWVVSSNASNVQDKLCSLSGIVDDSEPTAYIRVDSALAVLSLVTNTDCVGLMPQILSSSILSGENISNLNIEDIDIVEDYNLYYRGKYNYSPNSVSMMKYIIKEASLLE